MSLIALISSLLVILLTGMGLSTVNGEILTADNLQEHNTFEAPNQVQPADYTGATLRDGKLRLSIPPFSVVVLKASR